MSSVFTHKFDTPVYKGQVSFNTGLFIDGQFREGSNKTTIDVVDPSTGKVFCKVAEGTPQDVDLAVRAARKAYETSWGLQVPGLERAALLYKLADLITAHGDELAALVTVEGGKTWLRSKHLEVTFGSIAVKYYAGWADKLQGDLVETNENELTYVRREPYGVVGQIIPWNFPLMNLLVKIAPALAAGNTIILKPSELTPLSTLFVADLINKAGFPPGTVNFVNGYGDIVGDAITTHPGIAKIGFTGGTSTGKKIISAIGRSTIKAMSLELGGKGPCIILEDADIAKAIDWSLHGIYFHGGQMCAAGSRIFVHEKVYDKFLKDFTERTKQLKVGDPWEPGVYHGPQISQTQCDRIMGYIEAGKKAGAKVHLGGDRAGQKGYYVNPTIFTETTPDMSIVREEIFGPVACVIRFKDEDDIIRIANDTVYGLSASVFTKDVERGIKIGHKLEAGTVWVNISVTTHHQMPFGGMKQSGIGRECGLAGLKLYTVEKSMIVNLGLSPMFV